MTRVREALRALPAVVLALCAGPAAGQVIHYVRSGATGARDGSSWADAFPELVPALAAAQAGDQIWVAEGTYTPAAGGLDPAAMFLLPIDVGVFGGFAGDELTLAQRDATEHVTTLSGDLLGDDAMGEDHWVDNTLHLLLAEGTSLDTILDGFVVRDAHGPEELTLLPGGLRVHEGSLTIRRCTFMDNSGPVGALRCGQDGTTIVENCLFVHNSGYTGAIRLDHGHHLVLRNSAFLGNTSGMSGGAIRSYISSVTAFDCIFSGNQTTEVMGGGGALWDYKGTASLANCTFTGNVSAGTTSSGGAVVEYNGALTLSNCVLWGDSAKQSERGEDEIELAYDLGSLTLDHCLVEGWNGQYPGSEMLALDPLFVDALGPDGVAGTLDDDCRLQPGSPAIDSGDNAAVTPDDLDVDHDGDTSEPSPLDLRLVGRFEDDPDTPDLPGTTSPVVDRGACEFSRWTNLGHALGGTQSPYLVGFGSWVPGFQLGVRITGTKPLSFGFLFIGFTAIDEPLEGGVLVPFPQLGIGLSTDSAGSLTAQAVLLPSTLSQTVMLVQGWFVDASGPYGFTATNAVSGIVK